MDSTALAVAGLAPPSRPRLVSPGPARGQLRLLTSTASVLAAVISQPGATLRELARTCNRTERTVWQSVRELERAGLLRRRRVGRCNRYEVDGLAVARRLRAEGAPLGAVIAAGRPNGRS